MSNEKSNDSQNFADMTAWLQTPLGKNLLGTEFSLLESMINRRFGYHLLQLSCADIAVYEDSPIGHKFCLSPSAKGKNSSLVAQAEAIPLTAESVDMVVLHHALDYSIDPHQLLREADRVLIAGGHLLIIGFNPFSAWGARHKLSRRSGKSPWKSNLLSSMRLSDWLKLLDFKIEQVHYGLYSLPINNPSLIRYSSFMGKLAQRLNWPTGGIYVISAKKQALPMTPIREPWKALPRRAKGLALGDNVSIAPTQPHKKTLH
ncbi:class I SAM-dependent methyltransferase [Haliea sp. AH-315-K21]|uniref:SAM-dependent methyltransferase n=1 Tax=SAR86 cluster bacterium TaxID=2030880 RepID=A0A2A5C6Z2_9GAMM|nr:class I SAM-dependent methyltransferase [Haliea sp. AH-315-K21]PCJ39639.1 MAG: SAM-dependent methyltransferase [SAR86 cluster bacterium]